MKSYKILLLIVSIAACLAGCDFFDKKRGSKSVTISGKVGFPKTEGAITVKNWSDTSKNAQTLEWDPETYTYKGKVYFDEPGYYRVSFFDAQFVDVVLDKNDLEINVDGNEQNGYFEVLGSPDMDLYQKLNGIKQSFQKSEDAVRLYEELQKAGERNDEQQIEAVKLKFRALVKAPSDSMAQAVLSSTPSVAVIDVLSKGEIDADEYFFVYQKVAESLTGEWANYEIGKKYLEMFNKMKVVAIGQVAPEIELPNPQGKLTKLSSLRGKYVLIDFWAKWCGPCRRENPNVVAAYAAYKDKGFEVFGVSLDRTQADWEQAIAEDNLTWTHVSDLKYFDSEAAHLYNITYIPFSLLIDKNGVIIAKNLREGALHKKLKEILD